MLRAGALEVRPGEFSAWAGGTFLQLSRRELALLAELMRTNGRPVTRDELFASVWGAELRPGDRSVDVYVHKLRAKLAKAMPEWAFIHTHFSYGYRFSPERTAPGNEPVTTS